MTGGVQGPGRHGKRTSCIGHGCSGSGRSARFCSSTRNEILSGSWRRNLIGWGGRRFSIIVVSLEELLDVLDCVISCI